jgi:transcription elongation factor GreA
MIDVRKKLQEELNIIERELRVDLPKEILRAREHGDLSENAEYKAAKERQSYLEGRKAQLQARLAALSLVNLEKIPTDRAAYGSKVVLYDYDADKEIEYRLVSAEESDINHGLISITSPIGRSLVGKMAGDSIEIVTPSGKKDYELRSLTTIHELEEKSPVRAEN